jgi:hypothetical protein
MIGVAEPATFNLRRIRERPCLRDKALVDEQFGGYPWPEIAADGEMVRSL